MEEQKRHWGCWWWGWRSKKGKEENKPEESQYKK